MDSDRLRFLLVDDDPSDRTLVRRFLDREFRNPEIREVDTRATFLKEIEDPPDIVITDYLLKGFTGLEVLRIVKEKGLDVPVILLTGTGNEEVAIEAMKRGVADYVIKSIEHIRRLPSTIKHVLHLARIEKERHETEMELLLSDQILSHIPDTLLLTDLDGKILRWTGGATRTFGYQSEEMIGKKFSCLLSSNQERVCLLNPDSYFPDALDQPIEVNCRTKTGRTLPVEITSQYLHDRQGTPCGVVMVVRDITERKRMEASLREYTLHLGELVEQRTRKIEKLQRQRSEMEKVAATGQMAARMAHEINNPLAGIKNAFALIRREIPPDSKYLPYADLVVKEIDRITGIIQQMYKTYSPKAGRPTQFHLASAISDVCNLLAQKAKQEEIFLEVSVPEEPVQVVLPEGEINQILYNLILNAIQSSHPGGKVTIRVDIEADTIRIAVTDTGIGIPEEIRSRIFEPFFSTKEVGTQGGLGLGLAVSQSLAKSMGGEILVDSTVGQGTTFVLILPPKTTTEVRHKEIEYGPCTPSSHRR